MVLHKSKESKRVLEAVDSMKAEIIQLCSDLVKRQSVNPLYPGADAGKYLGGETECNQFLAQKMRELGCKVDLFEKSRKRANMVARLQGVGGGRSLIMNGHIDTVPFGDDAKWKGSRPLGGRVEGGRLTGRGAADMKGGVSAMCMAVAAIRRSGLATKGDLIIESVVGEETLSHELGTSAVTERGYRADAAIVAEPTGLTLQPATTGVLLLRISVEGKAAHSTVRDQMIRAGGRGDAVGVNAIEKGVKVIQALQQLEERWGFTKQHPLYTPGHFVIHPGVIDGAPHGNRYVAVVPDYCDIDYAVTYSPSDSPGAVRREVEDYLEKASKLDSWLSKHPPRLDWQGDLPAGEISPRHSLCKTISVAHKAVSGSPPLIKGAAAPMDSAFLNKAGIPTAVYGPGNLLQAHREGEYVEVEQLVQATKVLALAALAWCGSVAA